MMTPDQIALYLQRIGIGTETMMVPTLNRLNQLHRQHLFHIPFENFSVYTEQGVSLDIDVMFAKIVLGRRGGYCHELNELFARLLEQLGFRLTRHLGRVWHRSSTEGPVPGRTHQVSIVTIDDDRYLVDVGFGNGILLPLLLRPGSEQHLHGCHFRYQFDAVFGHLLELHGADGWHRQSSFTDEISYKSDFEMANFYSSRHPDATFTQNILCTLFTQEGRNVLYNRQLRIIKGEKEGKGEQEEKIEIETPQQYRALLREYFAIELPIEQQLPGFTQNLHHSGNQHTIVN